MLRKMKAAAKGNNEKDYPLKIKSLNLENWVGMLRNPTDFDPSCLRWGDMLRNPENVPFSFN